MLRNFLVISLRNILKNKGGSYLNLIGLTFGMAACLYIFNYVYFEMSYDRLPDERKVYRVETHTYATGVTRRSAFTTPEVGSFAVKNSHEIQTFTRLIPFSEERSALFRREQSESKEQRIHIETVYYAEHSIFEVLPIQLIQGSKQDALKVPNSIFLSVSTAREIFKDWSPDNLIVGLEFKSAGTGILNDTYIIAGVFEDRPSNTHLKFDALIALSSPRAGLTNVDNQKAENIYTYVLAAPTTSLLDIVPYPDEDSGEILYFRPNDQVHQIKGISNQAEPGINNSLLLFLGIIGLVILTLACTNYINNAIVNSIYRAKEIGVRKVLGAKPIGLIITFVGEAFLVNFLAGAFCFFLFRFGSRITELWTQMEYPFNGEVSLAIQLAFLLILLLLSTALSSLYPAFYMSSLNPIASLRSNISVMGSNQMGGANRIIKSLLVFQLSASIVFLSSVYIVYKQLNYMEKHDTDPFEMDISGIFPGTNAAGTTFTNDAMTFLNELRGVDLITDIRFSNLSGGKIATAQELGFLHPNDSRFDSTANSFHLYVTDHSFWKSTPERFLSGRNFSKEFGRDHDKIIVNESTLNTLGYLLPDSLIGKSLTTNGGVRNVIGVVRNKTATEPPYVYVTGFRYRTYVDLEMDYPGRAGEGVDLFILKMQHLISSRLPFFYLFDRGYVHQRGVENTMLGLFMFFSLLAIIISSIGMFGLSSFVTQKRNKEIGIRKILGAQTRSILWLLLYDFLKLVMYSSIFAIPLVLYGSKFWLENYKYRITIDPEVIALPILTILGICLIVVAEKCWRTASLSPISSLDTN